MEKIRSVKQQPYNGILFLQGVFKQEYRKMEDIFQERLLVDGPTQEAKIYDKPPVNFTNLSTWPKTTNLKCWRCHLPFKSRPWFEPQSIEPISEGGSGSIIEGEKIKKIINKKSVSIPTHGIFCSANCVSAYIDLHTKNLAERHNKHAMLKYVYEIYMEKSIPDIQPSPPPTEMIQYGGNLTESEYKQKIESLDTAYVRELEDNNFSSICKMYAEKIAK
jgi:hypothetical protein